jgi:hypothetical protein
MNTNELPAEWTDKQRAAYAALKASVETRTISFGKAPKDGWKESDRVAK